MSAPGDRRLGLDRPIVRRDFLNGLALVVGAPLLDRSVLAALAASEFAPEKDPSYYPPALTGLRGSHPGSFEAAHELRDRGSFDPALAIETFLERKNHQHPVNVTPYLADPVLLPGPQLRRDKVNNRNSRPLQVLCQRQIHVGKVDQYGRIAAVCTADGVDLNAAMVDAGFAVAYRQHSLAYVPNEERAKAAKKGLWAGSFEMPWDYRRD